MSDFQSKLPDFKELSSMAGKLYKDVKTSICEIIAEYKKNHPADSTDVEIKTNQNEPPVAEPKKPDVQNKSKKNPKQE